MTAFLGCSRLSSVVHATAPELRSCTAASMGFYDRFGAPWRPAWGRARAKSTRGTSTTIAKQAERWRTGRTGAGRTRECSCARSTKKHWGAGARIAHQGRASSNRCGSLRPDIREQSYLITKERNACDRGGVHIRTFDHGIKLALLIDLSQSIPEAAAWRVTTDALLNSPTRPLRFSP
jgi:hypothetical protein